MTSNVYVAKNVYGGDGLGRLGDGRVVFVPGAWAGEQVRAEIVEEKKHFVRAKLVEVVERSSERLDAEPPIPGMVYAGLTYKGELAVKEQQLVDFFERARIAIPAVERGADEKSDRQLNYRNKAVYHFEKQRGKWVVGYRLEPSHEILDVTEDPLARPEINAKLAEIRKNLMTLLTTGPEVIRRDTAKKANLTVRWSAKSGVKWWLGDAPKDLVLIESMCGSDFQVPAGGFYQVNPEVGDKLVAEVVKEIDRDQSPERRLLDLYCGVGVFGLASAVSNRAVKTSLVGIESGREAIEFAKKNAAALKVADAKFFSEEVGRNVRRIPVSANTTVVIDPPRDGLEKGVARWLAGSGAKKIIYVSCDPATLMRDLRDLAGAYEVERVKWFNMFPRTARFETMVVLKSKQSTIG